MDREAVETSSEVIDEGERNELSNNTRNDHGPDIQGSESNFMQRTSDPSYPTNSSSALVGRNKIYFTLVLENFITKNKKPPDRYNFNLFIIRAIKRAFRWMIGNQIPTTTCIKVDLANNIQMIYWNQLLAIYRENIDFITELSKTDTGPQTEGKKKGKGSKESKNDAKCFNNKLCREFFSNKQVQKAFFCVIEIIYSKYCPNELSERFKFSCCAKGSTHSDECMMKWSKLKDYFNEKFFEELDVPIMIEGPNRYQDPGNMDIGELDPLPD